MLFLINKIIQFVQKPHWWSLIQFVEAGIPELSSTSKQRFSRLGWSQAPRKTKNPLDDRDRRREKPIPPWALPTVAPSHGQALLEAKPAKQNHQKTTQRPPRKPPGCLLHRYIVPCYGHISKAIQRGFCSPKSLLFVQIPPGTTGPPITGHLRGILKKKHSIPTCSSCWEKFSWLVVGTLDLRDLGLLPFIMEI